MKQPEALRLAEMYADRLHDYRIRATEETLHDMMVFRDALEAEIAALKVDAERYRWLRDTLHSAVGGGVTVNDERLVYEKPEPGEEVRVYWYPDTPIGFFECKAAMLDEAVDAARGAA